MTATLTEAPRYMTVANAARYMDKTTKALRNMIARRQIVVIRKGRSIRLDRQTIDRWMKRDEY